MSLKNKYDYVIVRNNQSLGFSRCAYDYVLKLEKENEELKKQLADRDERLTRLRNNAEKHARRELFLESQQKEFKKYLEEKIKFYIINVQGYSYNLYEEILSKYEEIIEYEQN